MSPLPLINATPTAKPRKVLYENLIQVDSTLTRLTSYSSTLSIISEIHDDGALPKDMRVLESSKISSRGKYDQAKRTLTIATKSPHPDLTLIHEIGHFIDSETCLFGKGWASGNDSHKAWLFAVKESTPYKDIKSYLKKKPKWLLDSDRRHFNYLLQPHECWARCYQQFIASRSNHQGLNHQLTLARRECFGLGFWSSDEFTSIDFEMERIFTSIAWMP